MLKVKLKKIGKKRQPSFRIVVAEERAKLGGPPVEDVGSYNVFTKKASFNKERLVHWLSVGAKPTATAHNLLVREGIISGPKMKIPVRKAKKEPSAAPATAGGMEQTDAASAPAEPSTAA